MQLSMIDIQELILNHLAWPWCLTSKGQGHMVIQKSYLPHGAVFLQLGNSFFLYTENYNVVALDSNL